MRRLPAALLAVVALTGCAREEEPQLPAACRLGADAVHAALADAPRPVRLDGDTPLSACLTTASDPGDLLLVGEVFLTVATRLADDGDAVPLGYLLGAVRGRARETQGLHDELLRRLEHEAARVDDRAALRRGERAGLESG